MMMIEGKRVPFSPLRAPPFNVAQVGDWRIQRGPPYPILRGYFRGPQRVGENWVLLKKSKIWMSVTPMELESQGHHLWAAKGRVAVLGLGMGVLLAGLALKPEVTSITVFEKEPAVMALLAQQSWAQGWMSDVKWAIGDVFEYQHEGKPFDIVLADIWPTIGDLAIRKDMQRIKELFPAKKYAAWGMELDYVSWAMEVQLPPAFAGYGSHYWKQYSLSIGVPLIALNTKWMPHIALAAASNVIIM